MTPTVSVIVPVYNTASTVAAALDSVYAGAFGDFEILAVIDGSPDDAFAVLSRYAQTHDRVRVLTKPNGGLSDARNFALDHARGEFVAFLDSDDRFCRGFLEKTVAKAEKDGLDVVVCGFAYVYPDGRRVPAPSRHGFSDIPEKEYFLSEPMACVRLIRRSLFAEKRFRRGVYYEDLDLMPYLALETSRIGFVDEPLYDYVQRPGSIMQSAGFSEKMLDIFDVLAHGDRILTESGRREEFAREMEYLYIEHLLRSAALRFSVFSNARELFGRIGEEMNAHYPTWRENPYLKQTSVPFRLVVRLAAGGHFRLVRALLRLKGV